MHIEYASMIPIPGKFVKRADEETGEVETGQR
jgi:hypothetical protein